MEYSDRWETLIQIDLFKNKLSIRLHDATANPVNNISEIGKSIKEINSKAALINADFDVQYEKKGITILLLMPVK